MEEGSAELLRKSLEELMVLEGIELDEFEPDADEEKALRSGDYSEMIDKSQEALDELNEKADQMYQKLGMSKDELFAYAENPNNFSKEQWEALSKVKHEADLLKRRSEQALGKDLLRKSVEKERTKAQRRFRKKKNWKPV